MSSERIKVPLEKGGGMLAAVVYLAVLAFPEDKRKRTAFVEDLKAVFAKEMISSGWAKRTGRFPPMQYRNRRLRGGPLDAATRRLERERMPSAGLAIDLMLRNATSKSWLKIAPARGGVAIEALTTSGMLGLARQFQEKGWLAKDDANHTRAADFAKRFHARGWSASKPVLHLAIALQCALNEGAPFGVVELVRAPTWVPRALQQAAIVAKGLPWATICLEGQDLRISG